MHGIERAVSDWRRVYTRLCAVEEWLRHGRGAPPADLVATGEDLAVQVGRLQDQEEQALRAIDAALLAAKTRTLGGGERPSGSAGAW
jgi:hypothetical protein